MSAYQLNGTATSELYNIEATLLGQAYDIEGNEILGGVTPTPSEDYNEYSNDYQYAILQARNAWATEYRADDDIVPFVLTTDQHGYLNNAHGKALYDYLALAVNWTECSASLNLGDVCAGDYSVSQLDLMQLSFSGIPNTKQINVAGNHDESGISDDDNALDTMFDTYFNNSAYSGNSRYQHRGFETMIDTAHKIRYVCVGSWDFTDGVWYHFNISTGSLAWLINTLSIVDDYDIVILSHIQTNVGSMNQIYPAVDSKAHRVETKSASGTSSAGYNLALNQIFLARKNKTSGTIEDSSGVTHSYDFSSCTSDILCGLHGHSHVDWYNYKGGIPSIVFDAYRYDDAPFFLGLIDRTNECVKVWKIGESGQIQTYVVPFEEHVNPCTAITLDQHTLTIAVGESATLTPIFTTQYEDDGTYPQWVATWRSYTTSVASVQNGIVMGLSVGTSRVRASCGDLYDECVVTVTE